MADRIIELKWSCGECSSTGIGGLTKQCPNCGSPREKGEMQMDGLGADDYDSSGYNKAASITNPDDIEYAKAGADWFCSHCTSGNRGDVDKCSNCAAPRYGTAEEDHPDDPWEDDSDAPTWNPEAPTPEPARPRAPTPRRAARQSYVQDPVGAWQTEKRKTADRNRTLLFGGGVAAAMLLIGFLFWAFTTHEALGKVTEMTWAQNTIVQTWTQTSTREWKHRTSERSEVEPHKGSGERAGMKGVPGSCRQEHYEDERYACGTKRVCRPKTRSERYACGENCRSNGNGTATCSTKYCTRSVPDGETCTNETKYCSRPIYKAKCDYRTQTWRTTNTRTASGYGQSTQWPEVKPRRLDRLRYAADYTVNVDYRDRGKDQTYDFKPGDTKWLGMTRTLTRNQALQAEKAYREWKVGEEPVLTINNLGGVSKVVHAGAK